MKYCYLLLICLTALAQSPKPINVGILSDKLLPHSEKLLLQLKTEIKAVVGEDAIITFKNTLENNFDETTARLNYQSLVKNDTDIILSFGLVNNMMLYKQNNFPKPTIVFGAINRDFINIPKDQKTYT